MYYTKTKSRLRHLLSLCIALTMFQACDVDDLVGLNYDDVKEFGSFFGDPHRGTVIIHSQGGTPSTQLSDADLINLIKPVNTNDVIIANISQYQILDSRPLYKGDISLSQAETINDKSVDNLAKVIRHFKAQNKNVYVFGTGFGGYITQELIVRYGIDIADSYLIMGSRLRIENDFLQPWSEGRSAVLDFDATPTGVVSFEEPLTVKGNLNRLFAAIANQNYIELLRDSDLSNVTYIFSDRDEIVGVLDKDEQSFLALNKANLLEAKGSHDSGKHDGIVKGMREGFGIE